MLNRLSASPQAFGNYFKADRPDKLAAQTARKSGAFTGVLFNPPAGQSPVITGQTLVETIRADLKRPLGEKRLLSIYAPEPQHAENSYSGLLNYPPYVSNPTREQSVALLEEQRSQKGRREFKDIVDWFIQFLKNPDQMPPQEINQRFGIKA